MEAAVQKAPQDLPFQPAHPKGAVARWTTRCVAPAKAARLRCLDVRDVVEAGLGLPDQFAEARPFLPELG